jgi:hypothetical protein
MKLHKLTILLVVILTACPTVRSFGFIETVFDNLQTQGSITRNIATRAEQETAKKRAELLLQKQASLARHRYIMVRTTSDDDVAPVDHKKSTYVIYDTERHTTADKYAYSNITAPKGASVDVGGVDVCIAE